MLSLEGGENQSRGGATPNPFTPAQSPNPTAPPPTHLRQIDPQVTVSACTDAPEETATRRLLHRVHPVPPAIALVRFPWLQRVTGTRWVAAGHVYSLPSR